MKRTIEQARTFFNYTERSKDDVYLTKEEDAKICVQFALENSPKDTKWIEPFAGSGNFLKFMPEGTPAYDINPQGDNIIEANSLAVSWEGRSALTNIPFKLKKQCIEKALSEADFFWTIAPFSVLNMKDIWVDKVVLFRYGGWNPPRSYLDFITPTGQKTIYCGFFKIMKKKFKREVKKSNEIWASGVNKTIELDDRFYIREPVNKLSI